jgi:hypothetical protein
MGWYTFEYIYFRSADSDFKGGFRGIWKYTISFDYESFLLMNLCPSLSEMFIHAGGQAGLFFISYSSEFSDKTRIRNPPLVPPLIFRFFLSIFYCN